MDKMNVRLVLSMLCFLVSLGLLGIILITIKNHERIVYLYNIQIEKENSEKRPEEAKKLIRVNEVTFSDMLYSGATGGLFLVGILLLISSF